ncbi:MAG: FAD-dependent oxidoreductase [Bacillota bacterium]|jgi:flavin-dependent dehydrogenase|nr:FAD-dependent oxidoreductase [Thermoanaerobacteraceae bacterium]
MAKVYDVIVVGAGPAGCIAAKELARNGLKVLLLESKKIPRHKPCAGGLTRKTLSLLDPSSLPALCKIEEIAVSFRGKTFKPVKAPLATVERRLNSRSLDNANPD